MEEFSENKQLQHAEQRPIVIDAMFSPDIAKYLHALGYRNAKHVSSILPKNASDGALIKRLEKDSAIFFTRDKRHFNNLNSALVFVIDEQDTENAFREMVRCLIAIGLLPKVDWLCKFMQLGSMGQPAFPLHPSVKTES